MQKLPACAIPNSQCYTACGGTLISSNFVLTAAHCVTTTKPTDIQLTAGMHQQSSQDEGETRQVRTVSAIYVHPEYDSNTMGNDIALLRVDTPFNYDTYVQPACLDDVDPQAGESVIILGWGAKSLDTGTVDILQQAYTTVVDKCWRYWGVWVTEKQICVADPQTGDSACKGDSGGPIMTLIHGQYVASGVASFTQSCITNGPDGAPNVYTRISSYRTWIDGITYTNK